MPMPQTSRTALSSQTLGDPTLSAARAHEVADLVAGLGDLGHRLHDLTALIDEAAQDLRAIKARMSAASTRRTASARSLEMQGHTEELQQVQGRIRRLRGALHDAQEEMASLSAQHGGSSDIDLLRAQAQQEDLRARAIEAELLDRAGADARQDEYAALRRRKAQERSLAGGAAASGSHLQAEAASGLAAGSSGWQPPRALQQDFAELARRAGRFVKRQAERQEQGDGDGATSSEQADVQARFANVLRHPAMPAFRDPADLVQWVIRQSHADGSLDIQHYAHKVHFSKCLKETIREELSRARKFRSDHGHNLKDGVMAEPFAKVELSREPDIGADGVPTVREPKAAGDITRVEALDAHINDLQNMLASTGEDMQFSQLELQNMSQRQQQMMNVLSNLSKALHETSMAIIRKIGN